MLVNESFENNTMQPNFTRDIFKTIAEMKAVPKKKMPKMLISACLETGKIYVYNKNGEVDETLGLWREIGGSCDCQEETDTVDFSTWSEFVPDLEAGDIVLDGQGGAIIDDSNVSVDPGDIEPDE